MYINQIERNIIRPASDKVSARKSSGGETFDSLLVDAVELTSSTDSDQHRKNQESKKGQTEPDTEIIAGELDIKV